MITHLTFFIILNVIIVIANLLICDDVDITFALFALMIVNFVTIFERLHIFSTYVLSLLMLGFNVAWVIFDIVYAIISIKDYIEIKSKYNKKYNGGKKMKYILTRLTQEELDEILEKHQHYLNKDCYEWESMKADLSGFDLKGLNFTNRNLEGIIFVDSDLSYANFTGACLICAELDCAIVNYANFENANCCYSSWNYTDCRHANFAHTNLAYISSLQVNFLQANFINVSFTNASLINADFTGANIKDCNFEKTNLLGVQNFPFNVQSPESFIAYNYAIAQDIEYIVELEIPADAKLSAIGQKYRCNRAKVLRILNLDGSKADITEAHSYYNYYFVYKVGDMINVKDLCDDRWDGLIPGIRFFMNLPEKQKSFGTPHG